MAKGKQISGKCFCIIFLLSFISFCLQMTGLTTDGWLIMDLGYMDISMGLWKITVCQANSCVTGNIDTLWDDQIQNVTIPITHDMTEYRVETVLGVLSNFFVLCCVCCCSKDKTCKGYCVLLICLAVSAAMPLMAAGRYGNEIIDTHKILNRSGQSPIKAPFSVVVTGVGGLFAGFDFLIAFIETCKAATNDNSIENSESEDRHVYTPNYRLTSRRDTRNNQQNSRSRARTVTVVQPNTYQSYEAQRYASQISEIIDY